MARIIEVAVDWIEARIKCSLESAWTALRETVCSDIERWRALTGTRADSPTVSKENRRLIITATEERAGESPDWVTIEKKEDHIRLRRPHPSKPESFVDLRFVPRLNQAGECRLWLGEEELEFWQASRRILEPILFG